jgi:anti-sigma-K factor RskA
MGDRSRDEVLAGEYVLGVLSASDRRKVEARMMSDREFAAIVFRWTQNLAGMNDEYGLQTPPADLYAGVEKRLFSPDLGRGSGFALPIAAVWNSLVFWRVAAAVFFIAAGAYAFVDLGLFQPTPKVLVAEMTGDNNLALLANYDAGNGHLKITPVAAGAEDKKSLELWLIKGDSAPVSLGVLPQNGGGEVIVPESIRSTIAPDAIFAVSLEPFGGSPTGTATGPVLALGKLKSL